MPMAVVLETEKPQVLRLRAAIEGEWLDVVDLEKMA